MLLPYSIVIPIEKYLLMSWVSPDVQGGSLTSSGLARMLPRGDGGPLSSPVDQVCCMHLKSQRPIISKAGAEAGDRTIEPVVDVVENEHRGRRRWE